MRKLPKCKGSLRAPEPLKLPATPQHGRRLPKCKGRLWCVVPTHTSRKPSRGRRLPCVRGVPVRQNHLNFPQAIPRAKAPLCKGSCRRSRLRDCSTAPSTSAATHPGSTMPPTLAADRRFRKSMAGKRRPDTQPRVAEYPAANHNSQHQPHRHGYAVPPPLTQGRHRPPDGLCKARECIRRTKAPFHKGAVRGNRVTDAPNPPRGRRLPCVRGAVGVAD